jgi:hypothetical protein
MYEGGEVNDNLLHHMSWLCAYRAKRNVIKLIEVQLERLSWGQRAEVLEGIIEDLRFGLTMAKAQMIKEQKHK